MRNIILIGMPGCGKSTVGVVLAKALGLDFIDSDLVIQKKMGAKLHRLLDQYGDEGFRAIENRINAELEAEDSVIATGGSVIYGPKAMEHLREISTVVYLKVTCPVLKRRLGDLTKRGVVFKPGQTLDDLYAERAPLYEKYAHITINVGRKSVEQSVRAITAALHDTEN